jgi:hypothetical protein
MSKNAVSFFLLLMSTLQQNWRKGQKRFFLEVRGVGERGRGWGIWGRNGPMYAHMNK